MSGSSDRDLGLFPDGTTDANGAPPARPRGRQSEPPADRGDAWEPPQGAEGDGGTADTGDEAQDAFDPAALSTPVADQPQEDGPDPFDPASLRIGSDFNATVGLKKAILTIPVRKPDKASWVQAHPDPAYRLQTAVIEIKSERGGSEVYLVAPHLRADLAAEPTFRPKLFVAAISTQGVLFLWEVNLPRDDREDAWGKSALAAVDLATKGWVRVAANMSLGAYDAWQATGNLSEPQWPDMPFRAMLKLAFKDRYIDSLGHPILRRLRGEAQ